MLIYTNIYIFSIFFIVNKCNACSGFACIECSEYIETMNVDDILLINSPYKDYPCMKGGKAAYENEGIAKKYTIFYDRCQLCYEHFTFKNKDKNIENSLSNVKVKNANIVRKCAKYDTKLESEYSCKEDRGTVTCSSKCRGNWCNSHTAHLHDPKLIVKVCVQCISKVKKLEENRCLYANKKIDTIYCNSICYINIYFNGYGLLLIEKGCLPIFHVDTSSPHGIISSLKHLSHNGQVSLKSNMCTPTLIYACNSNWSFSNDNEFAESLKSQWKKLMKSKINGRSLNKCVFCNSKRIFSEMYTNCEKGENLNFMKNYAVCEGNCYTSIIIQNKRYITLKACYLPKYTTSLHKETMDYNEEFFRTLNKTNMAPQYCVDRGCYKFCTHGEYEYCNQKETYKTISGNFEIEKNTTFDVKIHIIKSNISHKEESKTEYSPKLKETDVDRDNILDTFHLDEDKSVGAVIAVTEIAMTAATLAMMFTCTLKYKKHMYRNRKKLIDDDSHIQKQSDLNYSKLGLEYDTISNLK